MKYISLILAILFVSILAANPRGMTTAPLEESGATIIQATRVYTDYQSSVKPSPQMRPRTEESLGFEAILPARSQYGLRFNSLSNQTGLYSSLGGFSGELMTALAKVPQWMRADLQNTLLMLTDAKRDIYVNLILSAQDPLIDEIAFAIAHSSPEYLNSDLAHPQLFVENASYLYSIDQNLQYVQIMDYGTHEANPSYYSTTKYKRLDANGVLEEIEVPYEIYYWYVVHPRLSDEIAAYVDPAIVENNSNHNNNITAPPTGVFWRSWLYTVQEGDYPVLADTLNQCQTLFNNNGTGGDAIRAMQWWINQTMGFTSNNERPHQPVRIYRKHIGRCGEYQDYTAAVARLGLIPCTSILSVSTDHVWNEFWEGTWRQWEPVNGYIDTPLVYENGWGKIFGSVFECRSDGYFSPVTERYSEGSCQIRIRVLDNAGQPVDGARVILAIFESSPRVDMIGFTGNDGWVVFTVGENRDYRARAETHWGIYPAIAGTYAALTAQSVDGETYDYLFTIDQPMPQPVFTQIDPPANQSPDYYHGISFSSPAYYLNGRVTWDDISSLGTYPKFYYKVDSPASVAVFSVNPDDLLFLQYDMMASIFSPSAPQSSGTYSFHIPVGTTDWYSVMDNSHLSGNAVLVSGSFSYQDASVNSDEQVIPPAQILLSTYPNPFTDRLSISYRLAKSQPVKLSLYNLRGQLVRDFYDGQAIAGQTDLGNLKIDDLPAGIYFVRLSTPEGTQTKKLVKIN
ncbi:MAG: hypothetical protein CVU49_08290 [Candidatus Cloacimonetes bacterium HGW-Cloacimonetes-2]|jgi:hypothetical protein|nr:MAG: hypothetical protein CVU49_08290 [Candidatus Cloacimonetes bacterium HGW-Cloacimonetes-2]